jgi:hypothetical protein
MAIEYAGESLGAPVWMGMRELDQLGTTSNSLWGSVSLDQVLELMQFIGS